MDDGDRLPLPSPKLASKSSRRPPRDVHMQRRRRHSGSRMEPPPVAELALSTIAEESSQHHSTSSSVSIDVDPAELYIESPVVSSLPPPPYTGVALPSPQPQPTVTVTSPACCVCHAARVRIITLLSFLTVGCRDAGVVDTEVLVSRCLDNHLGLETKVLVSVLRKSSVCITGCLLFICGKSVDISDR